MGLFSYKSYYKPGKGVEKDAPQKNAFFHFFELYGRKFWRFIEVNFIYLLVLLPILLAVYTEVYDTMYTTFQRWGYTGTCASYTSGDLTVTAKDPGASGNDYTLDITPDKNGTFTVKLYTDRGEAAKDSSNTIDTWFTLEGVSSIDELADYDNDYVTFSGSGPLKTIHEASLSGGDGLMSLFTPLLYLAMLYYQYVPMPIQVILLLASVLCYGPAKCGVTYVLRNYSRETHSWLSDIWDKAKENWKQGMLFGVLDCIIAAIVVFNLTFRPSGRDGNGYAGVQVCDAAGGHVLCVYAEVHLFDDRYGEAESPFYHSECVAAGLYRHIPELLQWPCQPAAVGDLLCADHGGASVP